MTRAMARECIRDTGRSGRRACAPPPSGSDRAWPASPRSPPRRRRPACRPTSPRSSRWGGPTRRPPRRTSRGAARTRCPASRPRASRRPPAESRAVDMAAHRRNVGAAVGELLLAMLGPTVVFGLFALLAVKFGAESRPYFDERPVVDDRPNWFPIAGSGSDDEDDAGDEPPDDGEPEAVAEPARAPARRQPAAVPLASARSAATSPSGV